MNVPAAQPSGGDIPYWSWVFEKAETLQIFFAEGKLKSQMACR
jgi:hypothetical protein